MLLLQHPREATVPQGTARLVSMALPSAGHAIGLSWRSLSHAAGETLDPKAWAVLRVGSRSEVAKMAKESRPFVLVDARGKTISEAGIRGLIVIDGTWKQAKALLWRNRWLLKLNQILLNPETPSKYSPLRRQPKRICLSTIEAVAFALGELGESGQMVNQLRALFDEHVTLTFPSQGAPSNTRLPAPSRAQ